MKIHCRKLTHYLEVIVWIDSGTFDLGLMGVPEAKELRATLQETISDLDWYIKSRGEE